MQGRSSGGGVGSGAWGSRGGGDLVVVHAL